MDEKRCSKCREVKPRSGFYTNPSGKGGLQNYCKDCHRQHVREWSKKNGPRIYKERWRKYRDRDSAAKVKRKYGLSKAEHDKMLWDQDRKCAICGEEAKLSVDHCHETGKVRGLLCSNCNHLLGKAKDRESILFSAILYLRRVSTDGQEVTPQGTRAPKTS